MASAQELMHSDPGHLATILFQMTTFTGIPQVVRAKGALRASKAFFLALCTLGCLYQAGEFLEIFLRFPVTLVVEKQFPDEILYPAFTMCGGRSISRSKYCKRYPDHCQHGEVKPEYRSAGRYATREQYRTVGVKWEEVLDFEFALWLRKTYINSSDVLHLPMYDVRGHHQLCYVVNHQLRGPNASALHIPTAIDNVLVSYLNIVVTYMFHFASERMPLAQSTLALAFHSPFEIHNPYFEGKSIELGKATVVSYRMVETHLLPWPYVTDCRDYMEEYRTKGSTLFSRKNCIQTCTAEITIERCKCFPFGVLVDSEVEFCTPDDSACLAELDVSHCYASCKPDCRLIHFETTITTRTLALSIALASRLATFATDVELKFENAMEMSDWQGFIGHLNTNEVTFYKYKPKYESVEAFMYLGGYLGMWLGASIFEMLDLLEISAYFFSLMRSRRPRQQEVTAA